MIRYAEDYDIPTLCSLTDILENCTFPEEELEDLFRKLIPQPGHCFLVWEEDGEVTAFLHMRCEAQIHHCREIAEILELVVHPLFRSRTIGTQLFERACEEARKRHCAEINLVSSFPRKDAHRFYEEKGMARTHFGFTMPL